MPGLDTTSDRTEAEPAASRMLPVLALCLRLLGLVTLLTAAPPVLAQPIGAAATREAVGPALLTAIEPVAQSPAQASFRLTFTPHANGFAPLAETPQTRGHAAMALALTSRASSAAVTFALKGLVRGIAFEQVDSVLIVHFATASPARAQAEALSPTQVLITVTPLAPPRTGADPVDHAPVPVAPTADDPDSISELIPLRYADVSEVVGLLSPGAQVKSNDRFLPREPGFGSTSLTGGSYAAAPVVAPDISDQPLGETVDANLAVDRRLNAIWVRGSRDRIARVKADIARIDVPVDSVVLETELVELTDAGARAVGIDFTNANGQIGVFAVQTGQYVPSGYTPNQGARLASGQLQAAIYAQVSKGNGKIVSRPRIAALSGSTAKIITGDALPILTSITLSGVNGVSQQVQYVNVGVTLQIAPRVADNGSVTSHVFCVVSSVTGYSQGYPTISQREAETQASVQDGESFVIGGLTQESLIDTHTRVPLLGSLPVIGQAFGTHRQTREKTELYIVVTPHILRHRDSTAAADPAP